MWTARNRVFSQQFFNADPGGGAGTTPDTPPVDQDKPTFTPEQNEAINNLVAKARKEAEEKTALRIQQEADAKAQADKDARERDEAAKRGEFDKVRGDLEAKVASTEQERDGAVSERDALRTYFEAEYTAAVKDLPDVIAAFKPADDALFAEKSAWLTKAKEQAAKVASSTRTPGNGPNPPVSDGKFDMDAATTRAQASGAYTA